MISIRSRLTILLSAAIALLFVATGIGVVVSVRQRLYSSLDQTLAAKANAIISAAEIDDGEFEIDSSIQEFAGFGSGKTDDYFEIRRSGGNAIYQSTPGYELKNAYVRNDGIATVTDGYLSAIPVRIHARTFIPKDDEDRKFQDLDVVVTSPISDLQRQLGLITTVVCIAGALAIFITIPIVGFALKRGLKPLGKLATDIQKIQPEQLDHRLETVRLPGELKPVGESLNAWLERLEASFERERRFSSHAAHELRTPLAELKTMAELGSMFPEEATPERFKEMLTVTNELAALLEKLSLLARAEAGRQPTNREPIDLTALINLALVRVSEITSQRNIHFETRIDPTPFSNDPVIVATIIQNLINNASNYAPEHSIVKINASPNTFTITNPAPDLAPADAEFLFERFWRKDASRTGYDHSGLGLSIVKACSQLLGGSSKATISVDYQLTIEVRLTELTSR
jgi:signal transduction histidine kinase